MITLQEELIDICRDSETLKVLVTTDEEGVPHPVIKNSFTVLDNGMLAYAELIERCHTYKNMLRNYWHKKNVAILLFNQKKGAFQIKGRPVRFLVEGVIWKKFVEEIWKVLPEADPAGIWTIEPLEVRNLDYNIAREEEEERMVNYMPWLRLKGPRVGK